MTLEELARHRPPMGGAPDTEVVQEILTQDDTGTNSWKNKGKRGNKNRHRKGWKNGLLRDRPTRVLSYLENRRFQVDNQMNF